jgi:NADH dehydrogenase
MAGVGFVRPRIVIIGGGFGGIAAAQRLRNEPVDVVVIDRSNHFVFQPLLYQVASGTLAPSDIAVPIRWYLRKQQNTRVILGEVTQVHVPSRTVTIDGESTESWDYLIVAAGGRHAYFGNDQWEPDAPGLKTLGDALTIRRRFLNAFEEAELANDDAERAAWQTIVIVGGGPTGVELAGIMRTMARDALRPDFRRIDTAKTRVLLVEGGPRLLSTFPEELSERARLDLEQMGVEVRLNTLVTNVTAHAVSLGDDMLPTRTVFWAAGNRASPLGAMLGAATDRVGRVLVNEDLTVGDHTNVFALGDMAVMQREDGRPVPGVCQGAIQSGRMAAENIIRTSGRQSRRIFRYFNKGDMATIGRRRAVADLGTLHFGGTIAWLLWLFIHIMYLAGFRNRLVVFVTWAWEYLTYQKGVRLIIEQEKQYNK